jgi:hypothetical protein
VSVPPGAILPIYLGPVTEIADVGAEQRISKIITALTTIGIDENRCGVCVISYLIIRDNIPIIKSRRSENRDHNKSLMRMRYNNKKVFGFFQ